MRTDCSECKGTGAIQRRPVDGGPYDCPECEASGNFFFTLVSRKVVPGSRRRSPHVVVGDCLYHLDRFLKDGAESLLAKVPYHFNPYREDTSRHAQWNYGHELAAINPVLAKSIVGRFTAEEIW